jgi:hypothetical protein
MPQAGVAVALARGSAGWFWRRAGGLDLRPLLCNLSQNSAVFVNGKWERISRFWVDLACPLSGKWIVAAATLSKSGEVGAKLT